MVVVVAAAMGKLAELTRDADVALLERRDALAVCVELARTSPMFLALSCVMTVDPARTNAVRATWGADVTDASDPRVVDVGQAAADLGFSFAAAAAARWAVGVVSRAGDRDGAHAPGTHEIMDTVKAPITPVYMYVVGEETAGEGARVETVDAIASRVARAMEDADAAVPLVPGVDEDDEDGDWGHGEPGALDGAVVALGVPAAARA